ncbi:MAG: hypothetical protein ACKO96_29240, partial [Flammeovirgaceae bacterium]
WLVIRDPSPSVATVIRSIPTNEIIFMCCCENGNLFSRPIEHMNMSLVTNDKDSANPKPVKDAIRRIQRYWRCCILLFVVYSWVQHGNILICSSPKKRIGEYDGSVY